MFDLISQMMDEFSTGRRAVPANVNIPSVIGIKTSAVEAMGQARAQEYALRLSAATAKPVVVPIPGTGQSIVVRSAGAPSVPTPSLRGLGRGPVTETRVGKVRSEEFRSKAILERTYNASRGMPSQAPGVFATDALVAKAVGAGSRDVVTGHPVFQSEQQSLTFVPYNSPDYGTIQPSNMPDPTLDFFSWPGV